uniref:Secretory carrier-associated membrane protein n=1 Tax=Amphiprion ocellaris TaxID=80972 RepID=A0AAQ5YYV6_AMPOC
MSDFDSNPFADPEFTKSFQDPSVTQVRPAAPPGLEEYNPFTDAKPTPAGMAPKTAGPTMNTQPAIMKPTEEPPAYSQPQAQEQSQAATELLRRQEELERKAAELDRREREMQSFTALGGRKNNWPPLPEKFPVGPCFYHDITVDIPVEFQKTVKIMYYLWMFHTGTLLANMIGCLSWFIVDGSRGVDFGLAILWFILFTPCSFVCWYRPLYGAFRSDSSFRFFVFFFVYICQVGVYVLQSVGIPGWGARSMECTAPPAPALRRPSRSSPQASCPTRQSRRLLLTLPPGLHRKPSRSRSDRHLSVQPSPPLCIHLPLTTALFEHMDCGLCEGATADRPVSYGL